MNSFFLNQDLLNDYHQVQYILFKDTPDFDFFDYGEA